MKLLQAVAMGLIASEYAEAQTPRNTPESEVYIPYDCYNESSPLGGSDPTYTKKSDRDFIPAMSTTAYPSAITGCWDVRTRLVTGM